MSKRKLAVRAGVCLVALLVLIQFVPYGHSHANPPVTRYKVARAAARLSQSERARLAQGIKATYSADPPGSG